ncbi:FecCD family ABC transporter permease [Roseibium suaedae]|uniref:Iron complex transport system permease protein n=1 Tax=Roseibium suaedae TaxID=735517 RepID=A0A1M7G162_9HYPH|nr:iron chelate uptake ABC transporter family permease subunit [Roseibium suaedae]SHM09895.1 iron complex transport system permease protein [Roseibium suaedae]
MSLQTNKNRAAPPTGTVLVIGSETTNILIDKRSGLVALAVCAVALTLVVLALLWGDFPIAVREVIDVVLGGGEGLVRTVVLEWRLPRALAALLFGAALAVSGALFQTITRNPLASPDIMGLANGSYTGMILALIFLGGSWSTLVAGSLIGGIAAAAVIYILALRDGLQGFRFIIVGIGVSAILASVNTWLLLRVELEVALFASAWGAGTLNTITAATLVPAGLAIAVLFCLLPMVLAPLRQMSLGDDAAASTGAAIKPARLAAIAIAIGLVSAVTSVAGPISFIALSAPQIARRLARSTEIPLLATGATGGVLLLASDLIAQHVIPLSLPVGVVTVVFGGVYLVLLLIREARRTM